MNIVKRLLIVVIAFLLFLVLFSFLLPSSLKLERKILIDATPELIFKQVDELKNWKNWATWAEKDSSIYNHLSSYSTTSSGVGATFKWNSKNDEIGEGQMKTVKSNPNNLIELELNFGNTEALNYWSFQEKNGLIEVTWGMNLNFGFNPSAKWFGLFAEDYIVPDMEYGLEKLKVFCENLPKINSGVVSQQVIKDVQWFVAIREKVSGIEAETIHSKLFNEISEYLSKKAVATDLPAVVVYHFWSDSLVDIEAGLLVKDSLFIEDSRIKLNKINTGKVITATHYGGYDRIPETYFSINEWIRRNEVQVTGAPWEIYVVDPSLEQNSTKWITEIYFPIQ